MTACGLWGNLNMAATASEVGRAHVVERQLEQAEFIKSNPRYHQPGAEHIRAVIGYLAWARNNQYLA